MAPLDLGGSTVDAEDYEGGLPAALLEGPHVGVTILRAGHQTVGLGRPVEAGHHLIVLLEDRLLDPIGALLLVDVHLIVVGAERDLYTKEREREIDQPRKK